MFINKYPYTDFHELNLDWLLKTVEKIGTDVNTFISNYSNPVVVEYYNEMVDHNLIYLYVGDEYGMNKNHWYYWDGTQWVDGGLYGSSVIDDHLDSESTNAVENRVITNEFDEVNQKIKSFQDIPRFSVFSGQCIAKTYDTGYTFQGLCFIDDRTIVFGDSNGMIHKRDIYTTYDMATYQTDSHLNSFAFDTINRKIIVAPLSENTFYTNNIYIFDEDLTAYTEKTIPTSSTEIGVFGVAFWNGILYAIDDDFIVHSFDASDDYEYIKSIQLTKYPNQTNLRQDFDVCEDIMSVSYIKPNYLVFYDLNGNTLNTAQVPWALSNSLSGEIECNTHVNNTSVIGVITFNSGLCMYTIYKYDPLFTLPGNEWSTVITGWNHAGIDVYVDRTSTHNPTPLGTQESPFNTVSEALDFIATIYTSVVTIHLTGEEPEIVRVGHSNGKEIIFSGGTYNGLQFSASRARILNNVTLNVRPDFAAIRVFDGSFIITRGHVTLNSTTYAIVGAYGFIDDNNIYTYSSSTRNKAFNLDNCVYGGYNADVTGIATSTRFLNLHRFYGMESGNRDYTIVGKFGITSGSTTRYTTVYMNIRGLTTANEFYTCTAFFGGVEVRVIYGVKSENAMSPDSLPTFTFMSANVIKTNGSIDHYSSLTEFQNAGFNWNLDRVLQQS